MFQNTLSKRTNSFTLHNLFQMSAIQQYTPNIKYRAIWNIERLKPGEIYISINYSTYLYILNLLDVTHLLNYEKLCSMSFQLYHTAEEEYVGTKCKNE